MPTLARTLLTRFVDLGQLRHGDPRSFRRPPRSNGRGPGRRLGATASAAGALRILLQRRRPLPALCGRTSGRVSPIEDSPWRRLESASRRDAATPRLAFRVSQRRKHLLPTSRIRPFRTNVWGSRRYRQARPAHLRLSPSASPANDAARRKSQFIAGASGRVVSCGNPSTQSFRLRCIGRRLHARQSSSSHSAPHPPLLVDHLMRQRRRHVC